MTRTGRELTPPVKALFVIGSMGAGGAERRLLELLQHLSRDRIAPALYLAYRRGELLDAVPKDVPIFAYDDGPRAWRQRLMAKLRCPSAARASHLSAVLKTHPSDLIVAWGLRCGWETLAPARRQRVPRIVTCCVDPVAELPLEFPRWPPWRWQRGRRIYGTADRVFVNAEALRQRLMEFYQLPADRIEVRPNLRDFARLETLGPAEMPEWPADGVRLLSVGRLDRQKGQHVLLEAIADLVHRRGQRVQCVFVGQGPLAAELQAQAERLNVADRVRFAGYVSEPGPYYRQAELFVLPSLFEGSPNALLEAAALGVPCVATDCPTGPAEILEGGKWGRLVPPDDIAALATAIEETIKTLPKARETASVACESIRAKHDLATGLADYERSLIAVARGDSA